MDEIFNDPTLWQDDLGNTPPREWDGVKYHFVVGAALTYKGTAQVGDTVSFDAAWTSSGATVITVVDGSGPIATVAEGASQPAHVSVAITDPSAVTITTSDDPSTYSCDITLTPVGVASVPDCDEMGRASTANVSAYDRTRVHDVRLMMGEKRCLVANFNGAISAARTITSVKWRCDFGYIAQMANARIQSNSRSTAVDITANWMGDSIIRCEATLDNGETYIQSFHVEVNGDPIFLAATSGVGPTVLTAP